MSLPALIHQPWSQRMLPSHRQTNCTERSWRQRRRFVVPRASMKSTADGNVFTWGGFSFEWVSRQSRICSHYVE